MHAPPCTFTRWALLIVTTLILGMLPACGTATPSPRSVTIVATATAAEPRPSLSDGVRAALVSMAKTSKQKGQATVRIITTPNGPPLAQELTPLRPNGQVQHAAVDADRQIAASVRQLNDVVADIRADQPGLDLLGLLDRASQVPGELHVISSGVSTVAPVDLRVIGWNVRADSVIDSIVRQGRLPNLTGRHVTFYGLGVSAGSQPGLSPLARLLVERLWTGICQQAGAESCTVAHDAPPAVAPVSTMPVPVVPVPDAITEGGCPVWASLNDAMLHFAPESAALPANADDALRPIVEAAARCAVQSIDVTGHIADTGTGDNRGDLAGRRARAVADRLLMLGLPSTVLGAVTGRDAREPIIPNFTGGMFDEAKAQQNRRVELTFHRGGR